MIALIDGDIIVYRAGFAAEKATYVVSWYDEEFGEPMSVTATSAVERDALLEAHGKHSPIVERARLAEPVENALYNTKSIIKNCIERLETVSEVRVFLTGPTNFRNAIGTIKPYKGNRKDSEKPVHGPAIRDYIQKLYPCEVSVDEEADDMLGYTQYAIYKDDPFGSVICSLDKDLDMIPGLHYNFVKGEPYSVDEDGALRKFYEQLIKGDSTDNIPGIPGLGDKKAAAALEANTSEAEMYETCRALYAEGYPDGDAALLENARLLWIRREPGQMWLPPTEREEAL